MSIQLAQEGHRERHALLELSRSDVHAEILTLWRSLRSNAQLPRFSADCHAVQYLFSRSTCYGFSTAFNRSTSFVIILYFFQFIVPLPLLVLLFKELSLTSIIRMT